MAGVWSRLGRSATKAYTGQQRIKLVRPYAKKAFVANTLIIASFYYYWWLPAQANLLTRPQSDNSQKPTGAYSEAWKKQHDKACQPTTPEVQSQDDLKQEYHDHDEQKQHGHGHNRETFEWNPDFTLLPPGNQDPEEFFTQFLASGSTTAAFYPLTWMKKLEAEPYSGNEPEWNEFTKLSNDPDAMQKAQDQLVSFCFRTINNKHAYITDVTGFPFEKFNSWVDITYPQMKPAKYERTGLVWIADGTWRGKWLWGKMQYEASVAKHSSSLLWPEAFFKGAYAAGTFAVFWYSAVLKNLFKSYTSDSPQPGQISITDLMSQMRATHKEAKALDYDKMSGLERSARKLGSDLHLDFAADQSSQVFQRQFAEEWTRSRFALPLGVCRFSGHIGLHGPSGHCKIEVEAYYLPKEQVFYSISFGLINLWPYSQSPGRRYPTDQFEDD